MSDIITTGGGQMSAVKLFDAVEIGAGESSTSSAVKIDRAEGFFSFQHDITGDGTLKFEYLLSLDGTNFVTPSGATDIATGKVKTSGTSGVDILPFPTDEPAPAPYMKIKATETAGGNPATLTGYLAVQ